MKIGGVIVGLLLGMLQIIIGLMGRIILKILSFTGLWITLIMVYGSSWIVEMYWPTLQQDNATLYWIYQNVYGSCTLIPPTYITLRNIIRIVKHGKS